VLKAEFSASLLQSSESHDPSQITLIWWFPPTSGLDYTSSLGWSWLNLWSWLHLWSWLVLTTPLVLFGLDYTSGLSYSLFLVVSCFVNRFAATTIIIYTLMGHVYTGDIYYYLFISAL